MTLCRKNLLANIFKSIEGILGIFCPSEDVADFLNSQGTLEPPTLRFITPILENIFGCTLIIGARMHLRINLQFKTTQRFLVADFATLSDERRSRSKIVLLFNTDKRTLYSKI